MAQKKPYSPRRLLWIGVAAVAIFCACPAFMRFANRDNPSAVPTFVLEELQTLAANYIPTAAPPSARFVELSLNPYLHGNLLTIEGRTNLPDRAILMYEVRDGAPAPRVISGIMAVQLGRYVAQTNLSGWQAGTIEVWVGFQTLLGSDEKQPEEVIERYGEMGEFLYGDNVTETDGFKRVEVTQTLEFSP